jgi:hypothetical protein
VLKHLFDEIRVPGSPHKRLYSCFVDFKKAYDLVRRDLLLECLRDLGVSGRMLGYCQHILSCTYDCQMWNLSGCHL